MFAMFWTRVKRKRTSKTNSSLGSCSSDCADPKGALSVMRYLRESQAYEGVQSRRSLNLSIVVTGLPLDPGRDPHENRAYWRQRICRLETPRRGAATWPSGHSDRS